jgi:hypothetical protein
MASLKQLENALIEADRQGNFEDAQVIADAIKSKRDSEEVTAGEMVAGLGAEVAIGTAGNVAGAALAPFTFGLSYPVLSFTSGALGNLAAQQIEGREDFSWGRMIAAGTTNVLPGGSALKAIGKAGVAKGLAKEGSEEALKEIPKELLKKAVVQETARGAAIGAGESLVVSAIDEGRLPTKKEFALYTGLGAGVGGVLGKFSPKFVEKFGEYAGKKQAEIDLEVATGNPKVQDDISTIASNNNPEIKQEVNRKITNQLNDQEQVEIAQAITDKVPKISFVKKHLGKYVSPVIPNWITGRGFNDISFNARNELNSYKQRAARTGRAIKKELKKRPELQQDVTKFINTNEASEELVNSGKLYGELLGFREKERELQTKLIGFLEADTISSSSPKQKEALIKTIKDSMQEGYTTSEYKMFLDANFKPDPNQKIKAINEIAENLKVKNSKLTNEEAVRKATDHLNNLESQSARSLREKTGGVFTPEKVYGILKEKKIVGTEQAKYLGLLTNPSDRVEGTLSKLGRLVVNVDTDNKIVNNFAKMGIGSRTPTKDFNTSLELKTLDASETKLYVTPETQAVVARSYLNEGINHTNNKLTKFLWDLGDTAFGLSKVSNVVLSPISYPTNFIGSIWTMVASGSISPEAFKGWFKGAKLASSEYGMIDDIMARGKPEDIKQFRDEVQRMQELGLGDGNVILDGIRDNLSSGAIGRATQKAINPASKAYQLTDTAARYGVFKHQQKSLSGMFSSVLNEKELEQLAATVTNDIYQQYGKVGAIKKALSRVGILNPYVSYVLELVRNTWRSTYYASQMVKGTFGKDFGIDPSKLTTKEKVRMRASGAARLTTLGLVTAGAESLVNNHNKETIGVSSEEDKAVSYFVPPYAKLVPKLYTGKSDDGKLYNWSDGNYANPYMLFTEAVKLAFAGESEDTVLKYALDQLLGEGSIILGPVLNAIKNVDDYGRTITNEKDSAKFTKDISEYLYKETVQTGLEREIKKWVQTKEGRGNYTKEDLVNRLVGIRVNPLNLEEQAPLTIKRTMGRGSDEKSRYFSALKRGLLSDVELEEQYQKSNRIYNEALDEVRVLASALTKIKTKKGEPSFSRDDIIKILRDGGIAPVDVFHILEGTKPTLDRQPTVTTAEYVDDLLGKTKRQMADELKVLGKTDPNRFKSVMSEIKLRGKDILRDVSEYDKLFRSLSLEDKAKRVINNPNLLEEQVRKGLITKSVAKEVMSLIRP